MQIYMCCPKDLRQCLDRSNDVDSNELVLRQRTLC